MTNILSLWPLPNHTKNIRDHLNTGLSLKHVNITAVITILFLSLSNEICPSFQINQSNLLIKTDTKETTVSDNCEQLDRVTGKDTQYKIVKGSFHTAQCPALSAAQTLYTSLPG